MKLFLDWSDYRDAGVGDAYADIPKTGGDYAKAIAVCIGAKACEQTGRGVMCPSYRISGNPALSTGGRVTMLKALLNGGISDKKSEQQALEQAMDLCVSCKGCKRECENEVDMALIKAEFLAQRHDKNGVPLRNRLFAATPRLLHDWPLLSRLIQWRNRYRCLAVLADKLFGISADVRLPQPSCKPFKNSATTNAIDALHEDSREVVLFVDSFNRNFSPQVATAAHAVLQSAGYRVHVLGASDKKQAALCCGRTYFANGMINEAKQEARQLIAALQPHLQADRWIIGLEPSCILSLRDEYLHMGLGEQAAKLAKKALLFEEFIAREQMAKRWTLTFQPMDEGDKYLVHGHCHQKAVGATKSMRKVLKMLPGMQSQAIESTCCGMAGYFGLQTEHVQHSRAMAEQGLFPALKKEPQARVIANGFSCQQQIINGGFSAPLHIAEVLNAALPKT